MSRSVHVRRVLLAALLLVSALHGLQSGAQGQGPGATTVEPVTQAEIGEIRQAFQGMGLREADVVRGQDGRITLVGEYENRDAVETAFAAARAVVGLRRVAPTTPGNIKYRLKGFDTAFASTVGKMMQRSPAKAEPAAAPVAPPPRPAPSFQRGARTYGLVMGIGKFKHLPESHGHEGHRPNPGSFDGSEHDVRLEDGSLAARAAGETVHVTKQHHHQAVDELGEGLVVTGWSALDELPEAVELPGRRFVLGVQWHPEVDPGSGLIGRFVDACREAAAARAQ